MLHTVLGAHGVIGRALVSELRAAGHRPRLVSRSPHGQGGWVAADLLDSRATSAAVAGSGVVYLVAGLPYATRVWRAQWPIVMRNVVDACMQHDAALVFLDNVYVYGRVTGAMTEETPFNPCSRKGEVRAAIARLLMDEMGRGAIRAAIVRSADFYGPGAATSYTDAVVVQRLLGGKAPQWLGNPRAVHTFSFTGDVARSLAAVGATPAALGRVWHAATSTDAITGEAFVRQACETVGRPYRLNVAPRWVLPVMSLFSGAMRENMEMLYQLEEDYRFDGSALTRALGVVPTDYSTGLRLTLEHPAGPTRGSA